MNDASENNGIVASFGVRVEVYLVQDLHRGAPMFFFHPYYHVHGVAK